MVVVATDPAPAGFAPEKSLHEGGLASQVLHNREGRRRAGAAYVPIVRGAGRPRIVADAR